MNRRAGFTLLEICIAVAICLVVILIAVPSVAGALRQQKLQQTYDAFNLLVHKAQARSINERRTYALVWKKESIDLVPLEKREGEPDQAPESIPLSKEVTYELDRTAALSKNVDPIWTFWRSGVCEPAIVRYKGAEGTWTVKYDPLTVHGTYTNEEVY